jgi:hypothetical protein
VQAALLQRQGGVLATDLRIPIHFPRIQAATDGHRLTTVNSPMPALLRLRSLSRIQELP